MKIDRSKPVLVTGATGYVAGRIIEKLLSEGIKVNASVRDPENTEKLKYLNDLASKSSGSITYFKSDLLVEGSFREAMKECELVFHTASPFTLSIKDAKKELVDPALIGTENVLSTVNEIKSVKRVVLTSSVVACYGDAIDVQTVPNKTITEDCWNTTSTIEHGPYNYSKTVAEKKAWEIQKEQSRWDMVVVNPAFVMGPGISPKATSESYTFMKQLTDGSSKSGVPYLSFGVVDVRDLALIHFNAGFIPEANGRNIACAETLTMLQMAEVLRKKFGKKYALPKTQLPKFVVYLFGPFIGLTYSWVKKNVGWPILLDNSKSIKELNANYRSVNSTLIEFLEQISD